jgi:antitoxin component of MazEF toxin-antitoxin module
MAIQVKTKRWGNSIGIIIPSETIEKLRIKPEEEISVEIEKNSNILREMFGRGKLEGKSARKMLDDFRRENPESKWM